MKDNILKYRSVGVIAGSLIFNLVTSLLVYKPDGVVFNQTPLTIEEWIYDITSIITFFIGLLMLMFDANLDAKRKIKEALLEASDEINKE